MSIYYIAPREQKTSVSLLDIVFNQPVKTDVVGNNTVTYLRNDNYKYGDFDTEGFIQSLKIFNSVTENLRNIEDRSSLYEHFSIPKKSGGLRSIDAPKKELSDALDMLKDIFENQIGNYFHHVTAFAYVKHRCAIDLVKIHQDCNSRWFLHLDFSNFFGSTTLDFVMRMFARVYPLNQVISREDGKQELYKALELCFLNGGLPQGTPMSPWITNAMMIPFDHTMLRYCSDFKPLLIYTRYADDLVISSVYDFNYREVERAVNKVCETFSAPFRIKKEKTHYGSIAGRNWILGVMLNKDNKITIGYRKKKFFKAMLVDYIQSIKNHSPWSDGDVRHFQGNIAYYRSVEREYIDYIISEYNKKFNIDVEKMISLQLKGELNFA